jgi:hypothetical protein
MNGVVVVWRISNGDTEMVWWTGGKVKVVYEWRSGGVEDK